MCGGSVWLTWTNHMARSWGLSLRKANKEIGTSVLQLQGTEDCRQAERAWKWILPQGLQIRSHYHQYFDFSLVRPWAEKSAHWDFWPTKLWDNKWVLLEAAKFMIICYAVRENYYRFPEKSMGKRNTNKVRPQKERETPPSSTTFSSPFRHTWTLCPLSFSFDLDQLPVLTCDQHACQPLAWLTP